MAYQAPYQADTRPRSSLGRHAGIWAIVFFCTGLAWLSLPFAIAELARHRSGRWQTRTDWATTAIVLSVLNLVFFGFLISAALIYTNVWPQASPQQREQAETQIDAYQARCRDVRPPFPASCPQAGNVPIPPGSDRWTWDLERGSAGDDVFKLNGQRLDVSGFWHVLAAPPGTPTNERQVNVVVAYVFHFQANGNSLVLLGVENKPFAPPSP